jgi:hypothetical protein
VPVPVRVTERSPPPPPFTFSTAVFAPFVAGLKVILIVQVACPTSDEPQLLVVANCPAAVPFSAMLVMATTLALVFVIVTDFAALVVLIG